MNQNTAVFVGNVGFTGSFLILSRKGKLKTVFS